MQKKPKKDPIDQPADKFLGEWYSKTTNGFASKRGVRELGRLAALAGAKHGPEFWDEVREWWPVVVLREAARQGDAEGYKRLLSLFLANLKITPPDGVLEPYKWPGGRPGETKAALPYVLWSLLGRPELNEEILGIIADTIYHEEWERARGNARVEPTRKNLRDRVRANILRHDKAATKPPALS